MGRLAQPVESHGGVLSDVGVAQDTRGEGCQSSICGGVGQAFVTRLPEYMNGVVQRLFSD